MFPLPTTPELRARRHTPAITYALIAANVGAYVFQSGAMLESEGRFVTQWGFVPERLTQDPAGASITVFSAMFLHGGLLHLLGNMWFLWLFGDKVEEALGRGWHLAFYLASGVAAAAAQYAMGPHSLVPMIGASGAIAGVMGGYALRFPRSRIMVMTPLLFMIELPAWLVIGGWFVAQVVSGAAVLSRADTGGVAFFAHVGGLVAGVGMMMLARKPRRRVDLHVRGGLDQWRPPTPRW